MNRWRRIVRKVAVCSAFLALTILPAIASGCRSSGRNSPASTSAHRTAPAQKAKRASTAPPLRPSQQQTVKTAAIEFARLQVRGRFAELWATLLPTEREFVAKTTYTRCMAPFHSPARLISSTVVSVKPIPVRPLRLRASAAATVTVHVRTTVASQTASIDLPLVLAKTRRRWYWVLDRQALHAYGTGNCPEESG